MSSIVQSILFDKDKYSIKEAEKWLKENNFLILKVDITPNLYRFRQISPKKVSKDNYKNYAIKQIQEGIKLVIAYKN